MTVRGGGFRFWTFDADMSPLGRDRDSVLAIIKRADTLAAIETLVLEHRARAKPHQEKKAEQQRRVVALGTEARRFDRALARAATELPHVVDVTVLNRVRADVRHISDLLNGRARPNHRPVNRARRELEQAIAWVLRDSGFRLTTADNGVLARVLGFVLEAAGEKAPVNLKPVLLRLCDEMRQRTRAAPVRWLLASALVSEN